MIEKYLTDRGLGCGTVANFSTEILKGLKLGQSARWYFKTPIKVDGYKLKTAVIDMAFPFVAIPTDIDEKSVLERIEANRACYEDGLMNFLKRNFIVPPNSAKFSMIPFWATETGQRNERKDFAGVRIHIINAVVTVKYRETWF